MISLRQGKAKNLLEGSRNSALTAVETYNKPNSQFRVENYIVLMIIAWTKLFHAYFQATMGEKYFYKERNGRYKIIDGEKRAWELKECIKQYKKTQNKEGLDKAVEANLKLFIMLRNRIEHSYWAGDAIDMILFGECQALLFNYENFLVKNFGEKYSINSCLAYALQFSHMRPKEQRISQRMLLSKEVQDLKRYIEKYKMELSQDIYDSQEYSIKFLLIPKVSNTNRCDLSLEFVDWNSLDAEDKKNYEKITAIIKDKIVVQRVSNANLLKPSKVVEAVKNKTGIDINISNHTLLWKAFNIRPQDGSQDKFETNEKYCLYDEPHNDYMYTTEWVNFIVNLIESHNFNKDNIKLLCKDKLDINDYL